MLITALRNKKKQVKFSIKIPHLTSTVHRLLSDRLLCGKEPFYRVIHFEVFYVHRKSLFILFVLNGHLKRNHSNKTKNNL